MLTVPRLCFLIVTLWQCSLSSGAIERVSLERWDFDGPPATSDNWNCLNCHVEMSPVAHKGPSSAKISDRGADWAGMEIKPNVTPGKRYYFSVYFRMLNQLSGHINHEVQLRTINYLSSGGTVFETIASFKHETQCDCFRKLSGDFFVQSGVVKVVLRVYLPDTGVNYLLDSAELFEVIPEDNWRQAADDDIAIYRTGTINIIPKVRAPYTPENFRVEIERLANPFAFGCGINEVQFLGTSDSCHKYREFILAHFQWATPINRVKWPQSEPTQGTLKFDMADDTLDILEAHGIRSHGHSVLFNAKKNNPNWVKRQTGEEMKQTIKSRLETVVSHFKGRLEHWDVDNEYLADDFYETATGQLDIMEMAFYNTSAIDPEARLFMNEYGIFKDGGRYTQPYITKVQDLLRAGVPIAGLGVQAHITGQVDVTLFRRRLDDLAALGLPIWITELTVNEPNMATRTQGYEDMLRLFYSHPAVEGVIIWGFWDGATYDPTAALAEGPDVTLNSAGRTYFDLWNQWQSNAFSETVSSAQKTVSFTAHLGEYEARIYENDVLLGTRSFSVTPGKDVYLNLIARVRADGKVLKKLIVK